MTGVLDAASTLEPTTQAPASSPTRVVVPKPGPSLGQIFNVLGITAIHVGTVIAILRGATWKLAALAAATYVVRMFAITAVYHRYFSHRSYKTSRGLQFLLALLGTTATQKGPLWWGDAPRPPQVLGHRARRSQPAPQGVLVRAHGLVARPRARGARPEAHPSTSRVSLSSAGWSATTWSARSA